MYLWVLIQICLPRWPNRRPFQSLHRPIPDIRCDTLPKAPSLKACKDEPDPTVISLVWRYHWFLTTKTLTRAFLPPRSFNPFSSLAIPHVYPAGPCEKVSFISLTFFILVNIGSWRSSLQTCQLQWNGVTGNDMHTEHLWPLCCLPITSEVILKS